MLKGFLMATLYSHLQVNASADLPVWCQDNGLYHDLMIDHEASIKEYLLI